MNLLSYSLTALVVYIGLFIGFILALIAKEELKAGKKYFIFIQKVILLLVFIFLLIFIKFDYILIGLILAIVLIFTIKNQKEYNKQQYIYIILAVIFYIASKKTDLFVIESSLIFLYGLPTGTLLTTNKKKESILNILKNISFILIAIILYLLF